MSVCLLCFPTTHIKFRAKKKPDRKLLGLCSKWKNAKSTDRFVNQGNPSVLSDIRRMLLAGLHSSRKTLILNDAELDCKLEDLPLEELASILASSAAQQPTNEDINQVQERDGQLPKVITFPYSRHSSYAELCDLLKVFKPMDVYPCTVDEANWHKGKSLFYFPPEKQLKITTLLNTLSKPIK